MNRYIVAPAAEEDLLVIWHYYARELTDPELADRMVAEIIEGIHTIAGNPAIGHIRNALSEEPLRFWGVRKYLIIYRAGKVPVEVVRVLHGARDVRAILHQ